MLSLSDRFYSQKHRSSDQNFKDKMILSFPYFLLIQFFSFTHCLFRLPPHPSPSGCLLNIYFSFVNRPRLYLRLVSRKIYKFLIWCHKFMPRAGYNNSLGDICFFFLFFINLANVNLCPYLHHKINDYNLSKYFETKSWCLFIFLCNVFLIVNQ